MMSNEERIKFIRDRIILFIHPIALENEVASNAVDNISTEIATLWETELKMLGKK